MNVKKIALMSLLLVLVAATLSARPPGLAPEIDPGSISAASALVFAGLMMIRGRKKR
jgi:hypothetical protein